MELVLLVSADTRCNNSRTHVSSAGPLPARLGELRALEKLDCWDNFLEGEGALLSSLGGGWAASDGVV